jgi:ubiquinone/menaquinone biosynthesis C-methylase UbiE
MHTTEHTSQRAYLPAAGRDWLLPVYDILTRLFGVRKVHRNLIAQANLTPAQRILEIGCGTGNLLLQARKLHPGVEGVGIDPDPRALALSRRKAGRRKADIQFDQGFAEELPYPDGSFDRVLSAFMLHHVPSDAKLPAIQEARRVLKPGGSLHLVDFEQRGEHQHGAAGLHGLIASTVHSRHGSSSRDLVLDLMSSAGFEDVKLIARDSSIMGPVVYYRAARAAGQ